MVIQGDHMALYTISDLHLPIGIDKPMDIFGGKWNNYVKRLENNWQNIINDDDWVVLPGDISWATYLEQSIPDFEFLQKLNGFKIISKGNHDYWWTTMSKMNKFLKENSFDKINFMHNNSFIYKNIGICGTRGWNYIGFGNAEEDDKKIYEREAARLELSIKSCIEKNPDEIIVFFHYPPVSADCLENEFTKIMKKYNVKRCVYGHLHAQGHKTAVCKEIDGIKFMLVSCDYTDFIPIKLCD